MRQIFLLCFLILYSTSVFAVERHALIIGNSGYLDQSLSNPINDATDMAAELKKLGYKIHGGGPAFDLDRVGIERTVRTFARQLPKEAHALFYFAGHGMATDRDNYLIPVRHSIEFQEQLPDRAVSIGSVVELLKNANPEGINVLLLDACRDNPLTRSFRSVQIGLERFDNIPQGVFVGYAADYGQVAADGIGRNGTYTNELLRVLREESDVIIELAHRSVKNRVYEKTDRMQSPVSENKIYGGDWCFGDCKEEPIVTTQPGSVVAIAPEHETGKSNKRWMVVGGVVLSVVVAGLLLKDDDDTEPNTQYTLELTPP